MLFITVLVLGCPPAKVLHRSSEFWLASDLPVKLYSEHCH